MFNLINKNKSEKGSLTVEATIVLPIFIFIIIAIGIFIKTVYIHELIENIIYDSTKELAKSAYLLDLGADKLSKYEDDILDRLDKFEEIDSLYDEGDKLTLSNDIKDSIKKNSEDLCKQKLGEILLNVYFNRHGLTKRKLAKLKVENFKIKINSFLEDTEEIDASVQYEVRLDIPLLRLKKIPILSRIVVRAWVQGGSNKAVFKNEQTDENDEDTNEEDTIVYVSSKGSKYHKKGCSAIFKDVKKITVGEAKKKGYKPCEICESENQKGYVYITKSGDFYNKKYHKYGCSSIFKDIKEMKLKDAKGRYDP